MPTRPKSHGAAIRPHKPRRRPDDRASSAQRGYGYRWQQARVAFLREHPLCVACEREGRVVPATEVDHVTPHKGDESLFWAEDNWQPLCKTCHSRKTVKEDGGWGRQSKEK